MSLFGSSKKVTVGYRYYMGLHFGVCYGPIDSLLKISVGDRTAWQGMQTTDGTVVVDAPELFGGDEREGGVSGNLDVAFGSSAQAANAYLQAKLGASIPAFRGILSLIWKGGLISSNNPYIKPWAFRLSRIAQGWQGGTAWYAAKAPVPILYIPGTVGWQVQVLAHADSMTDSGPDARVFGPQGAGVVISGIQKKFGSGSIYSDGVPDNMIVITPGANGDGNDLPGQLCIEAWVYPLDYRLQSVAGQYDATGAIGRAINLRIAADGIPQAWIESNFSGLTQVLSADSAIPLNTWTHLAISRDASNVIRIFVNGVMQSNTLVFSGLLVGDLGRFVIAGRRNAITRYNIFRGYIDEVRITKDLARYTASFTPPSTPYLDDSRPDTGAYYEYGMNPAHIIYQCLTDPQWGMGYPTSQIDSANFTAAADLFYTEGLGLCMVWNQQSSIEDFVRLVLDHAGAILAVDPSSGQFILNPIRGDYDPGTLPVYNESNVIALESWQRVGYGDTVNEITVVYRDFQTNKDASVTVQDLANVQAQGAVVSQSRQYPGLPTQSLAARVAQRDLIAAATPLAKGKMTINRAGWDRIPGDVIKLTWPKLGLSSVICRVLAVDTGTLEDGTISVEIAEDVFGLPASSYVAQESAGWEEPNTAPQLIVNWEAVEAPYWDVARSVSAADLDYLTNTSAYLYAVAARPGDSSLVYAVYTDAGAGLDRKLDGTYAPTGTLSAQLSISGTSITLADGIDLSSVEAGDLALIGTGQTAEWVEILTTSSPTFTIARGCLDTTPRQHAAATRVFIPAGAYGVDETEYATSQSISIQLADIATGGEWGGPFDLRAVTMGGRFGKPYPPGNVQISGQAYPTTVTTAAITATWAHRDRTQQTAYVVHQDEASIGPEAGTTYTVRWYKPESTLVRTDAAVSGTTSPTYTPLENGPMKVEITAVRDGLESWQAQSRSFTYSLPPASARRHMLSPFSFISVNDSLADFVPGTGAFTVEGFFRFNTSIATNYSGTLVWGQVNGSIWADITTASAGNARLRFGANNVSVDVNSAEFAQPVINTWYHWVFQRDGSNNFSVYWNGTRVFSGTVSANYNVTPSPALAIGLGGNAGSGNYYWVDEFRYTGGLARYSGASITVPTEAFSSSDPNFANVKALLHFDGSSAALSVDSSGRHTLSFGTNIDLDTSQYKF